jgi:hypothetical protein
MTAQMIVELPDGAKIYFGDMPRTGLAEVGVAEDIARVGGDKFKAALGSLASLVAALQEQVGGMVDRPDKVEMEFGASLSGDCNLWVVSGEGKAEFKVKLAWGK